MTGASGFIGGHLARRLALQGRPLRCLVRASSDTRALSALPVELALGDLREPRALEAALEGCERVVHCAALVSDWATAREIVAVNRDGTRNLLDACVRGSVKRFVHISTTDVYSHPGTRAVDESTAAHGFGNWYAQTKREAEAQVQRYTRAHSLDSVILRPATVYGPGSREVISAIARALGSRQMLMIAGGRAVAGLCYVENLIDAALLALEHPRAPGATFNVSDGLEVTWRQLLDDLADGLGCPRARWSLPYRPALALGFVLEQGYRLARASTGVRCPPLLSRQAVQVLGVDQDFSAHRLEARLGWSAKVGYRAGLAATLDWLNGEPAASS